MKQTFILTLQRSNAPTLQRSNAPTLQRSNAKPNKSRDYASILVFALFLGLHSFTLAQPCNLLANFSFTVSGCDVSFQPYSNGSGMAHFWTFQTSDPGTGFTSASNIATPVHTFGSSTSPFIRTVTHSVTIGGVIYTCTKQIYVMCTEGCDDRFFSYTVNGCTVTFYSPYPSQNWNFGDGNSSNQPNPTHTYTADGDYLITFNIPGTDVICRKTIRVACGSTQTCCTTAFTGEVKRECSKLILSLNAECTGNGTHQWTISPNVPNACMNLTNFFQGVPMQGMIQVTNINTCIVDSLIVTHRFICPNGTVQIETHALPILDEGIFIGKDGATTPLTDYNCVLPGALYNGACTVYSSGIVSVDKDFTFTSANVRVQPGLSGFDVIKNFTMNQNTVVSGNSEPECNCLWRGIYVYGAVTMTTDSDASIQDALYAIRAGFKNKLSIKKTLFAKNFIGIRGTEGQFSLLAFQENKFNGLGPLKDICILESLNDIVAPTNGNLNNQPIAPVPYFAQRGFAGMYLERYMLNLTPLLPAFQNVFREMAYGIMAYDGNVDINRNSIFTNIAAGAYGFRRTAGILFLDRQLQGPNTFLFTGNGQLPGGNIDFQNCILGMHVRSEQSAAPTQIGIAHTRMSPVRTGIYLDARFSGGEFAGAASISKYVGVKNNQIDASIGGQSLISNAGISFHDFSPGVSDVEISNNVVNMSYPFTANAGGATGITAHGAMLSDPGPGVVEVDIYENRVTLSNGAENGIGFAGHPNGWIRNNAGGDINSGNGIFVMNGDSWSGIIVNVNSNNNLVACNEVTVLSNVVAGQLSVDDSQNGQYLRNSFTGPGNGAHFEFSCLGSEYRCNDMSNNTTGLLYNNFAETNDQGTFTVTNGNRWFGPFSGWGADADISVNYGASKYYVRAGNNETPPSMNPPIGGPWFFSSDPNATAHCILSPCPAPPPPGFVQESSISSTDTLIAKGLSVPNDAPYATERTWQQEFYLWNKIKDHPDLAQGNDIVQNYLAGLAGSNIEAFGAIQSDMRSAFTPSESLLSDVQSRMTSIQTLETQIWVLDSLLGTAVEANQVETLTHQRSALDSILSNLIVVQETIVGQFEAQRLAAIPGLLAQVASINPANICETNLQRVYGIYLLTYASNVEADSSLLAELEAIAMQCPLEGGPGAPIAGILYQGFTGILPVQESCENTAERAQRAKLETHSSLALYPNPNQGSFTVSIPRGFVGKHALLQIRDARGGLVRKIAVQGERTITLNLIGQPNGLYFISLTGIGMTTEALPFIIQH